MAGPGFTDAPATAYARATSFRISSPLSIPGRGPPYMGAPKGGLAPARACVLNSTVFEPVPLGGPCGQPFTPGIDVSRCRYSGDCVHASVPRRPAYGLVENSGYRRPNLCELGLVASTWVTGRRGTEEQRIRPAGRLGGTPRQNGVRGGADGRRGGGGVRQGPGSHADGRPAVPRSRDSCSWLPGDGSSNFVVASGGHRPASPRLPPPARTHEERHRVGEGRERAGRVERRRRLR